MNVGQNNLVRQLDMEHRFGDEWARRRLVKREALEGCNVREVRMFHGKVTLLLAGLLVVGPLSSVAVGENWYEEIERWDSAIQLNPNNAGAYVSRGQLRFSLKQYFEAIKDYDKAIELEPTYAVAYVNRAHSKFKLKQYFEAIKDYDKAIEFDPSNKETMKLLAYICRGDAKFQLNQYFEAIRDYDKAIELDPTYVGGYEARAKAKNALGHRAAGDVDRAAAETLRGK